MSIDKISVTNLRGIEDSSEITISPITLLVGPNSVGKSTFARIFPLVKQSIETRTTGPILWYGRLVDFGDIRTALRKGASEKLMSFGFRGKGVISRNEMYRMGYTFRIYHRGNNIPIEFRAKIFLREGKNNSTAPNRYEILVFDNNINIGFDDDGSPNKIEINGVDFSEVIRLLSGEQSRGIFRHFSWKLDRIEDVNSINGIVINGLVDAISTNIHHRVSIDTIRSTIIANFALGSRADFLARIKKIRGPSSWVEFTKKLSENSNELAKIIDRYCLLMLPFIIESVNTEINKTCARARYIRPLRANAERHYRAQELAIDEIDPEGKNLHIFLNSLSKSQKAKFHAWLTENFGIFAQANHSEGHLHVNLTEVSSGDEFNLADMGFGFSQVLPILTQLWSVMEQSSHGPVTRIIIVEQPELHLHPKMQARLAIALLKAIETCNKNEIDLRIILETHSEALINKIGLLISTGDAHKEDVSVCLFERHQGAVRIVTTNYSDQGLLQKWPLDFFDY